MINFRLYFRQNVFSKEAKILIKDLRQIKGYTATRFKLIDNSKPSATGQENKF